jgi:hypothetical protein
MEIGSQRGTVTYTDHHFLEIYKEINGAVLNMNNNNRNVGLKYFLPLTPIMMVCWGNITVKFTE